MTLDVAKAVLCKFRGYHQQDARVWDDQPIYYETCADCGAEIPYWAGKTEILFGNDEGNQVRWNA